MKQILTHAIVLARTNYQEADRILTLLTSSEGKIRVLAKGVRKSKSKMAGGIELFSISEIGFIKGKGDLSTLTSSRLETHYGNIVKDMQRTMWAYDILKSINRLTEDTENEEYFELLSQTFSGLDDQTLPQEVLELWFYLHLLRTTGHEPNLNYDGQGKRLNAGLQYIFDYDDMVFRQRDNAPFSANHIKVLRLGLSIKDPVELTKIKGIGVYVPENNQLIKGIAKLLHYT